MRLLSSGWDDGFLDFHKRASDVRIQVRAWAVLAPVTGQYFVRPRSWRMVLNYVREIGPRAAAEKVASRLRERRRNEKFVSLGLGTVLEPAHDGRFHAGDSVAFLAYNHPRCVDVLALDERFVVAWNGALPPAGRIAFHEAGKLAPDPLLVACGGWSPESGWPVDQGVSDALSTAAARLQTLLAREPGRSLDAPSRPITERTTPTTRRTGSRAALFGLGNYAKTVLLPNLDPRLHVEAIHELDPAQLGAVSGGIAYDTSPEPRADERYDAWLIAGYHHTHAPLAIRALEQGAYALVEKPLATTLEQLEAVRAAMSSGPSRVLGCFQRRFHVFNELARRDLGVKGDEPIHYHCIVFEVPLPPKHWYRWPTSRTRLVSNGCHWIDHFLHLNQHSAPVRWDVFEARNGDVVAAVELENGASFSMTLTDHGSSRLGVRDHVELRANGVTVRMDDMASYEAEDEVRVLRREHVNRMEAYERMYREVSRRVLAREPGDAPETLRSTELVLRLEESLAAFRARTK